MKAIDFNDGWSWRHLDAAGGEQYGADWRPTRIPHDPVLAEPRHPDAPGGANTGWFVGRDYEYRKQFTPDASFAGRTAVLEFEGVYRDAEVWIDGARVAYRPYGYTNFHVDITDRLVADQPIDIRVVSRNAEQPNSRWYSGAGIYRPVVLWLGDRSSISLNGVRVRTLSIDPPRIAVSVRTDDAGTIAIRVREQGAERTLAEVDGTTTGEYVVEIDLPGAALWSPGSPALHRCDVEFRSGDSVDTASERFGIRTLNWGERGFLINCERTILNGACIHHDNGVLGAVADPDAEERKVRIMLASGYNAIRSAHNPCSKALLDACDRLGMLVVDEYIDHWYVHKTQYDFADHVDRWWRQDLQDMVEKDVNHPSVIMYSIGNEVGETAEPRGIELTRLMTTHLHDLDSTRPVTCGINIFFNFLRSIGMGVYSDKKARKEAERGGKRKKSVGSEFFNDMAGLLGADFMKRGATLPACDVKTRDAFAELDVAGYNYGVLRYERDLAKYPDRLILGTETFCADAYRFRELAKRNPRLIGDFVWAGMDYLGETAIGAWEYRDYAPEFRGFGWLTAGSGRVDITGRALGEALYTRVALEAEQGPLIAVRPVNHTGERHSPSAWKMSNAVESWSWTGCEGKTAEVEVYARAASVELRLNGRAVARKRLRNDCIARLKCPWEPGRLEAVAFDEFGAEIGRHELRSAAGTISLVVDAETPTVERGRLVFVRLRYADDAGTTAVLERGTLRVDVTGGQLEGLGSGSPYNREGYVGQSTGTYFGEALAVIRADDVDHVTISVSDGAREIETVIPVTRGIERERTTL